MDRLGLLQRLDAAWSAFQDSYAGLSAAWLTEPGVTGDWSVRDILAHVTTWEEEALKYLPLILEGGTPPRYRATYGGIDAFNALMTERKKSLPLSEVLRQVDEVHRGLSALVESTPEDQFARETRFRRRLRLDTTRRRYGDGERNARPDEGVHAPRLGPAALPERNPRHPRGAPAGPPVRPARLRGGPAGHRARRVRQASRVLRG